MKSLTAQQGEMATEEEMAIQFLRDSIGEENPLFEKTLKYIAGGILQEEEGSDIKLKRAVQEIEEIPQSEPINLRPSFNNPAINKLFYELAQDVGKDISDPVISSILRVLREDRWTLLMLIRACSMIPRSSECLSVITMNRGITVAVFMEAKNHLYVRAGRLYQWDEALALSRKYRMSMLEMFNKTKIQGASPLLYRVKDNVAVYV